MSGDGGTGIFQPTSTLLKTSITGPSPRFQNLNLLFVIARKPFAFMPPYVMRPCPRSSCQEIRLAAASAPCHLLTLFLWQICNRNNYAPATRFAASPRAPLVRNPIASDCPPATSAPDLRHRAPRLSSPDRPAAPRKPARAAQPTCTVTQGQIHRYTVHKPSGLVSKLQKRPG